MRYMLLVLLGATGCGSSVLPESPDAKAIKESFRQVAGDTEAAKVKVTNLRAAGHTDDYLQRYDNWDGQFLWNECEFSGRCTLFRMKNGGQETDDWMAVFDDKGEVIGTIKRFKKKATK